MEKEHYSMREIDGHFDSLTQTLERIEVQVVKTNGRVSKLEKNLLIIACVVATTIVLKFPQVISTIKLFI